jgi:hypothetical protein
MKSEGIQKGFNELAGGGGGSETTEKFCYVIFLS